VTGSKIAGCPPLKSSPALEHAGTVTGEARLRRFDDGAGTPVRTERTSSPSLIVKAGDNDGAAFSSQGYCSAASVRGVRGYRPVQAQYHAGSLGPKDPFAVVEETVGIKAIIAQEFGCGFRELAPASARNQIDNPTHRSGELGWWHEVMTRNS